MKYSPICVLCMFDCTEGVAKMCIEEGFEDFEPEDPEQCANIRCRAFGGVGCRRWGGGCPLIPLYSASILKREAMKNFEVR